MSLLAGCTPLKRFSSVTLDTDKHIERRGIPRYMRFFKKYIRSVCTVQLYETRTYYVLNLVPKIETTRFLRNNPDPGSACVSGRILA